jgi:hypothetical protein
MKTRLTMEMQQTVLLSQIAALKNSFTIKDEIYRTKPIQLIYYNNILIGIVLDVFTIKFNYYHAPTMIRLFPSIFERKYFPEALNFYIYKCTARGVLTCEQLTNVLNEIEHHKQMGKRILKTYLK